MEDRWLDSDFVEHGWRQRTESQTLEESEWWEQSETGHGDPETTTPKQHWRMFRDRLMDRGSDKPVRGGGMSTKKAYRLEDEATILMKKANAPGESLRRTHGILDNGEQVRIATQHEDGVLSEKPWVAGSKYAPNGVDDGVREGELGA